MKIILNGEEREFEKVGNLSDLIQTLDLDVRTLAIGHNGTVVPKSEIKKTEIQAGDQIDLVRFVAGG